MALQQLDSSFQDLSLALNNDMVDLYVGPNEHHFHVHKQVLCKIPYFSKLFEGAFRESAETKAKFPEDDRDAFGMLLTWIYTNNVPSYGVYWTYRRKATYARFYSLADKYCIPQLMDKILDAIRYDDKAEPLLLGLRAMGDLYNNSPPGSKLRLYIAHMLCSHILHRRDHECVEGRDKNPEIVALIVSNPDLLQEALDLIRGARNTMQREFLLPRQLPDCLFHQHQDGEDCPWSS